jgi:hypothetical protein
MVRLQHDRVQNGSRGRAGRRRGGADGSSTWCVDDNSDLDNYLSIVLNRYWINRCHDGATVLRSKGLSSKGLVSQ